MESGEGSFALPWRGLAPFRARMGLVITATRRPARILLMGAAMLAALTGCAAEPVSTGPRDGSAAADAPTPEIEVGDVLTAEQATALNDGNELMKAYPVGAEFIAVEWGQPIPEAVTTAVTAQVVAAAPTWGTNTDSDVNAAAWQQVRDAMKQESQKLGGVTIALVSCAQSFSTEINTWRPTWVMSEPGPVGEYESKEAVLARADAWAQEGRKMYVVVDNLGC